jgi:SAM-dependent methyltransferase
LRLGTYYRSLVLERLGAETSGKVVLDVGCYDGYFLSTIKGEVKVGIDLSPASRPYCPVLQADACALPFKDEAFDLIFALDVIEHLPDDVQGLNSLTRVLARTGTLWLSTPSEDIRIFPPFLTEWLSKRWGDIRIGYSTDTLMEKLPKGVTISFIEWNEPFYRAAYFALRTIWAISPRVGRKVVNWLVRLDARWQSGYSGHLYAKIQKVASH